MSQQLKQLQNTLKSGLMAITVILAVSAMAGCQGYSITGGPGPLVADPLRLAPTPGLKSSTAKSILVFPIQNGTGVTLSNEELVSKTEIVKAELEAHTTYTVINNAESLNSKKVIDEALKLRQPLLVQARQAGKLAKAPAVLFGSLGRFAEFKGSSSPESPIRFSGSIEQGDANSPQNDLRGGVASSKSSLPGGVGFNLVLIDVVSGQTLWSANFDLQERSVAENLFQLKRQLEYSGARSELDQIFRLGVRSATKQLEAERKK